jgi:ADP-heptose:LPS heptosyltransferase
MEKPLALVIAAGSLGDSLFTLPALRYLQSRGEVTVAGTQPFLSLDSDLLGISQVVPLDPLLQKLLTPGPLESSTADFLSRFKEAYVFFKDKDEPLLEKLASIKGLQVYIPSKPFKMFLEEARSAADYWLETATRKSLSEESPFRQSKLQISESLRQKGSEILASLGLSSPLVIHPGSGSPKKNAPLSFFRTAAERAGAESRKQVLVAWGEAEEKSLGEIREAFKGLNHVRVLAEPLPLKLLAAVLSQSAAYLGNDSGVTQLAAACGLRTFAVFNSTDARVWAPQANAIILSMLKGNLH